MTKSSTRVTKIQYLPGAKNNLSFPCTIDERARLQTLRAGGGLGPTLLLLYVAQFCSRPGNRASGRPTSKSNNLHRRKESKNENQICAQLSKPSKAKQSKAKRISHPICLGPAPLSRALASCAQINFSQTCCTCSSFGPPSKSICAVCFLGERADMAQAETVVHTTVRACSCTANSAQIRFCKHSQCPSQKQLLYVQQFWPEPCPLERKLRALTGQPLAQTVVRTTVVA